MKKVKHFLILFLSTFLFAIADGKAQVVVSKIPTPPKIKRFARPTKYHVWRPDEWMPAGNKYVFMPGYWDIPPTPKSVWKKGSWRKTDKGYVRINGYWQQEPLAKR